MKSDLPAAWATCARSINEGLGELMAQRFPGDGRRPVPGAGIESRTLYT